MAMYEVPAGTRRLPVEHLPIDAPSATLTPELDVVVDGETVGSVDDAELAQLAATGVTPVVAADGGAVVLPPAGQVLPVNTPPREPWALLPAGERYVADLHGSLPVEAPAQVLVSLGFDDAGEIVRLPRGRRRLPSERPEVSSSRALLLYRPSDAQGRASATQRQRP